MGVPATRQDQGHTPPGSDACTDAARPAWQRALPRLSPRCCRAATGSPPPLPDAWRPGRLSKAVARVPLAETARAHGWARTVNAWPVPGGFAHLASYVGPRGGSRRPRPAASAQAHWREAGPMFVPAGPARWPAASVAPVTTRPEETPAGPLGTRGRAWSAASRTSWGHRSARQVPGEEAFDAADEPLWSGRHRREKRRGCGPPLPVEHARSILVDQTAGPSSGRAGRGHRNTGAAGWRMA